MDKTEILNPIKSFWNIFHEKILDSHRFLSDRVGAFSTLSSALFAWYYFKQAPNKFYFVNTDHEKLGVKKGNSVLMFPFPSEETTLDGSKSATKVSSENEMKPKRNKKNVGNKNWSEICCNFYSDEEIERIARKYDDNYKDFWENAKLSTAQEDEPKTSHKQPKEENIRKFETPIPPVEDLPKNVPHKEEKIDKIISLSRTKRPKTSTRSHKEGEKLKKDDIDPNSNMKNCSKSARPMSKKLILKKDMKVIVDERLKKEKERKERLEKMKKEREVMLAKIKADRKIREEMARKTREQLAKKESEEMERKKKLRMERECERKKKQIATTQSTSTFRGIGQGISRKPSTSSVPCCNRSFILDNRQKDGKTNKEFQQNLPQVCSKDSSYSFKCHSPRLDTQNSLIEEKSNVGSIFTDEKLIDETSESFKKLMEAVKLFEKDAESEDEHLCELELYKHCQNELEKYKTLVEEFKSMDNSERRRSSWKNNIEIPAEINKVELVIHKKVNIELPVGKDVGGPA